MNEREEILSALIVEDDEDFVSIFRYLLKPWPFRIVRAQSAQDAVDLAASETFDLYLIDLQLSDGDSSSVFRQLRTQGRDLAGRCIVVTAFPILARGFTDFPVVDKARLQDVGSHLLRILGRPKPVLDESAA